MDFYKKWIFIKKNGFLLKSAFFNKKSTLLMPILILSERDVCAGPVGAGQVLCPDGGPAEPDQQPAQGQKAHCECNSLLLGATTNMSEISLRL